MKSIPKSSRFITDSVTTIVIIQSSTVINHVLYLSISLLVRWGGYNLLHTTSSTSFTTSTMESDLLPKQEIHSQSYGTRNSHFFVGVRDRCDFFFIEDQGESHLAWLFCHLKQRKAWIFSMNYGYNMQFITRLIHIKWRNVCTSFHSTPLLSLAEKTSCVVGKIAIVEICAFSWHVFINGFSPPLHPELSTLRILKSNNNKIQAEKLDFKLHKNDTIVQFVYYKISLGLWWETNIAEGVFTFFWSFYYLFPLSVSVYRSFLSRSLFIYLSLSLSRALSLSPSGPRLSLSLFHSPRFRRNSRPVFSTE